MVLVRAAACARPVGGDALLLICPLNSTLHELVRLQPGLLLRRPVHSPNDGRHAQCERRDTSRVLLGVQLAIPRRATRPRALGRHLRACDEL